MFMGRCQRGEGGILVCRAGRVPGLWFGLEGMDWSCDEPLILLEVSKYLVGLRDGIGEEWRLVDPMEQVGE